MGTDFFLIMVLVDLVLMIMHDCAVSTLHELKHAKAINSAGKEALILIPKKKLHNVKVGYKNGVKIIYTGQKEFTDNIYEGAMTLSSDDFQTMTDQQIREQAGAGLFFSVKYAAVQFVGGVTALILYFQNVLLYDELYVIISLLLVIGLGGLPAMDLLKILYLYLKAKKGKPKKYDDVAVMMYPSGFKDYIKSVCKQRGGSVYAYYNAKFDEGVGQ